MSITSKPHSFAPIPINGGIIYAALAYGSWGLLPIYWKFLNQVPAVEVLSHRIIWSVVFLSGVLMVQQRWAEVIELWRSPKRISVLLVTGLLLAFNWGIYIYGVNTERVVETSLGYFINPLVTVLLGFIILNERLHWAQWVAVGLATVGVVNFIWQLGTPPWIALALAASFACYGLLRKLVAVAPMLGLAVEALLVAPIALLGVMYWSSTNVGHFGASGAITLLFIGAGVVTSMPLLWFNNAAKRLNLSTLGFMQYLAPSLQLILGVFVYQEPFTVTHGVTFSLIWTALILYSITSLMIQPSR